MKNALLVFLLSLTITVSKAQFVSAIIGIDGLTCSACSFATEKSIRQLDFVDSVRMQLDKNVATVYFKAGKKVSVLSLARKVLDAGFSVRSMDVVLNIEKFEANENACFNYANDVYQFVKVEGAKPLSGYVSLHFIGERFMQKKEYAHWKLLCSPMCNNYLSSVGAFQYYVTIR